jgi:hypothetical protein
MTNDKLRIHVISGNGMRRNRQGADGPKDRTQLLKHASFYLVVAVILLVTNQAAKNAIGGANQSQSQSLSNLHVDLSVAHNLEPDRLSSSPTRRGRYVVRFRLTNQGNQPIFYPVTSDTNHPVGQIVYRIAPQSDWKPLSEFELSPSSRAQLSGRGVAWIEMPPGGWADGEYEDPGSPAGDHAIKLDVKVAAGGKASPLLSRAYSVNSD